MIARLCAGTRRRACFTPVPNRLPTLQEGIAHMPRYTRFTTDIDDNEFEEINRRQPIGANPVAKRLRPARTNRRVSKSPTAGMHRRRRKHYFG